MEQEKIVFKKKKPTVTLVPFSRTTEREQSSDPVAEHCYVPIRRWKQ